MAEEQSTKQPPAAQGPHAQQTPRAESRQALQRSLDRQDNGGSTR